METKEIKKLDQIVINRIAAGEVIQKPMNVVKELFENSIDSGAKQISITTKNGGLKLIQIQDDGCGIRKEDLSILCHRFTTSKLSSAEELQSLQSFGFRGEALASVSHVAHLSIVTKTASDPCAYRARYKDGELDEEPKMCAGNQGTTVVVEDLFYNNQLRKKTVRSALEEQSKIVDMVSRYAIRNCSVGISLKRHGEASADLRTLPNSSLEQNISVVHGGHLAKELIPIALKDERLFCTVNGRISNPNFFQKKFVFLLFVNGRSVECAELKRALELIFFGYLPKHSHPFIYLDLEIEPRHLDVNVHPTKSEVHFLNETEIIKQIAAAVEQKLMDCNESRTYSAQSHLPPPKAADFTPHKPVISASTAAPKDQARDAVKRPYDHELVRTDFRTQKLDAYLERPIARVSFNEEPASDRQPVWVGPPTKKAPEPPQQPVAASAPPSQPVSIDDDVELAYEDHGGTWRDCELESIGGLRTEVIRKASKSLRSLVKNHTFVGCVSARYAVVQFNTGLYLMDTEALTRELFYQVVIFRFGNFGKFSLAEPTPVKNLLMLVDGMSALEAEDMAEVLMEQKEMLKDYFSLELDDGRLMALPNIIGGYFPQLEGIPEFLKELATEVDWTKEERCLKGISRAVAGFFSFKSAYLSEDAAHELVENVLFPAIRTKLFPPSQFTDERVILKLTDLHDLYKVFERC